MPSPSDSFEDAIEEMAAPSMESEMPEMEEPESEEEEPEETAVETPTGDDPYTSGWLPKSFGLRPYLIKDPEQFVHDVLEDIERVQNDRSTWMEKRLARYAKLRGWLETENGPWDNSSDQHVPVLFTNVLRATAGLFNAIVANRPIIHGRPTDSTKAEIAEKYSHLLDHQFFVDNDGERFIERFCDQFVIDGTMVSFQPRVIERRIVHESRVITKPISLAQLRMEIERLMLENEVIAAEVEMLNPMGSEWEAEYTESSGEKKEVRISVYDYPPDPQRIEIIFRWDLVAFDSPTAIPIALEDLYVPEGAENLQPSSGFNPKGAPWVAHAAKLTVDSIMRRIESGVYDLLTEDQIEELKESAVGAREVEGGAASREDILQQAKESDAGITPLPAVEERDREWITVITVYKPVIGPNGVGEEAVMTILKEPKMLARARYLTENYPGLPPTRPLATAKFIPVEGQFYGIGLVELLESLSDFIHELVNDSVNGGRLGSIPWFVYRAASGLKPEVIRMGPGDGIPVDNPATDIAFPAIPAKDQSWAFNMIGMAGQWVERLAQISALQFGQVPQGKASALRTVGTTMAILQQSAALPEQILRRAFMGLKDIFTQFHLLNTRYLPPRKRFLIMGKSPRDAQGYDQIDDRSSINIPLAFDFQSTLVNTNKGVVSQALQALGAAIINPIGVQFGLVTPENIYNWATDYAKALQLDSSRYVTLPPTASSEPVITVQEALMDLLNGLMPPSVRFDVPLDQAMAQLQQAAPTIPPALQGPYQQYLGRVQARLQEMIERQQMMQAAAMLQAQLSQGEAKGGRPPEDGKTAPETQTEAPTEEETAGGAIGGSR